MYSRTDTARIWQSLGVGLVLLCWLPTSLSAQEEPGPENERDTVNGELAINNGGVGADDGEIVEPADRSRILYLDVPVPIEAGIDPVFPDGLAASAPSVDSRALQRVQVMRDYDQAIVAIEQDGGAWDRALTEELTALGALQQEDGAHPQAIDTLSRAMHINRINEGLHTLGQVPLVERMIDSYAALGDWPSVDLYQNYLYFVQQKAYGSDDPRLIPVLHRLGQWNIEAFNLGYGDPLGGRLSTAQLLFNAATRMVGIHFGRNDERYISYLRSVANSAYLVSLHPDHMSEIDQIDYLTARENLRRQLNERRSPEPRGYQAGVDALQEVVDIYREAGNEPYKLAEALANQADWQLMFDRFRTAQEIYGEAWQVLAETENGEELIRQLFGQVRPIPTFAIQARNLSIGSSDSQERQNLHYDYADVSFSVNQFGAPRDVQVLTGETEENARQLARLRREILRSIFRPVIVDGQIESSEGHVFRYRYWY